jgi:hypothetical protein
VMVLTPAAALIGGFVLVFCLLVRSVYRRN